MAILILTLYFIKLKVGRQMDKDIVEVRLKERRNKN